MKIKKIILLLGLSIFGLSEAQDLVKQFTFDTPEDMQGWRFYDGNGNGNQWVQGQNIIHNGTELTYGTSGVLRHSKNLVPTGGYATGFETEDDWIISPEIDLTDASGTITFAGYVGRQGTYVARTGRQIFIYVSTPAKPVPDLADFQALSATFTMGAGTVSFPWPSNVEEFTEVTRDISSFAGQKIYIGMWTNNVSSGNASNYHNINIDEISIYADNYPLATQDTKTKSSVAVYPNPATDVLYLKGADKANVAVYNAVGQRVLSKAVTNGQLNVSALQKGIYTITIDTNGKPSTTKFIKK